MLLLAQMDTDAGGTTRWRCPLGAQGGGDMDRQWVGTTSGCCNTGPELCCAQPSQAKQCGAEASRAVLERAKLSCTCAVPS